MLTIGDRQSHYQFPLHDLAGYLTWENGARRLVQADGWGFTLVPGAWQGGEAHRQRLDSLVPAGLHLPQPPETAPEPLAPESLVRRWWLAVVRSWRDAGLVLALLFTFLLGLAVWRTAMILDALADGATDTGGHALATLVSFGFLGWTVKMVAEARHDT